MRIVFDAYWWVSGPAAVRRVLREIVSTWAAQHPDDELVLVVRARHAAQVVDAPPGARVISSRLYPQGLFAHWAVARAARRERADAVLVHNFAARTAAVSGVYLHDVMFETNPEWFTRTERGYFSLMTRWVRAADLVFTSTATEADRIRHNTRAREVAVVGIGLSAELTRAAPASPMPGVVPSRFLLAVGRVNARKNLGTVITGALEGGRLSESFPLIIVGAPDGKAADLGPSASEAVERGIVRFTGHIPDDRLRWLYSNCSAFVFLSLGEGFGMPPVEAAWFGASVLVSDLPVFHETLGAVASYVDPRDPEAVSAAISAVIDSARRDPEASRAVAARHSWDATVAQIRASLLEKVASRLKG